MESHELVELQQTLVHGWNIKPISTLRPSREEVLESLARRVAHLLRYDYQRLVTALYVLDVPESRFEAALALGTEEAGARALAEAILDREIEKLETRRQYRRSSTNFDEP